MVNTTSATIQIATQKQRTAPRYLVRFGFDNPILISTAGSIVYNGELYANERGMSVGTNNVQGAQITLDNSAGDLSDLFNAGVQDTPVQIYIHYDGDSEARAFLFISGWRVDNNTQIVVDLVAEPSRVKRVPNQRYVADPGNNRLNYMPRSGDVLMLGNATVTLE